MSNFLNISRAGVFIARLNRRYRIIFPQVFKYSVAMSVLCTCLFLGTIVSAYTEEPPIKAMTFAKVDDVSLYYEVHGEGEPILLIHGGLSHAGYWSAQINDLARDYLVIAVDSRGHGRSSLSDKPITYKLLANDFLILLDKLNIQSTNILGWSDGGIIALELAIRAPKRLKKIIAFGANYHPSGVKPNVTENSRFREFLIRANNDYLAMSPEPNRWSEFLKNITKMWSNEPNFSDLELQNITVPTLVLGGQQEEAVYPAHIEELSKKILNSKLIMIPETGHFAMLEKPEKFNEIVRSFLK
jgi:pimeloyl-ACP methyl ester carboxylesterase